MSDNNWPGEPGVPLNPEQDGWHWVGGIPYLWRVFDDDDAPLWQAHHLYFTAEEWSHKKYGGPCLTPAEVDARVKEARRDALKKLERHFKEAAAGTPLGHENRQRGASTYNWLIYCASIISALGEKE